MGIRAALETFLVELNAAGLTVRLQASETEVVNRAPRSVRRSMFVDFKPTDISISECGMQSPICSTTLKKVEEARLPDSDAI